MTLNSMPIRRKLTAILLLTSVIVILLMSGAFFTYEFLTFRQATIHRLATLGEITAANSTAAVAFADQAAAHEILAALKAEPHIVAASLYDQKGRLFAEYPRTRAADSFPAAPGVSGYRFEGSYLTGFQPVVQGSNRRLGTLYLRFDMGTTLAEWRRVSLAIGGAMMVVVFLVAWLLSRVLQRQVSNPILTLAETARAISEHRDYSVRAIKSGEDEVGLLTEAFNQMLAQIQELNRDLEERVRKRTAQLEAANQELEAFSYSVSHDLRAPLRHIDGFAGLLTKHAGPALDEQSRRYIGTISGAAKQMGRLIDDLLAFSRTNRTSLNIVAVDHDALLAAVIRDNRFDRTDRTIDWHIAPLPRVHADPAMLRQVWINLIDNAVKYSGKVAQPRIEIGSQPGGADAEHVFFVRDNGVGFDMNYVDKLFGVFQRLHATTEFEGTGIGLANVRRIVARHGGRTWAEGRVNEGATFYFSLPGLGKTDGPPKL